MSDVANYQDPTPGEMGWGLGTDTIERTHVKEMDAFTSFIENTSLPVVYGSGAIGGAEMSPDVEKILRSKMLFDEGWSFFPAESLLAGFTDDETWMFSQVIGNCVGASHGGLLASKIAHEIIALGEPEESLGKKMLIAPFIPYSYGVGRMAGNMLGPGDGSYCSAQMLGTFRHGFLPCFVEGLSEYAGSGDSALPQGTASANRLFGSSRNIIEKWIPKAKSFEMTEAPVAKTADDAKVLICDKKVPLQICSGWGFAYDRFDTKYNIHLYKKSGSWSHSMQVMAIFAIKGAWFVCIRNQWGLSAHKGSPEIKIPKGCFCIPFELFASWMKSAEVMGIGNIKGLPSNPGM